MHKQIFSFLIFLLFVSYLQGQRGNNAISINVEAAIPGFQKANGFGFYAKGLYGIGKSGQITLSVGFANFSSTDSVSSYEKGKITTRLIPVLFGYKQNLSRFFIEPKIGLGGLSGKFQLYGNGDYSHPSVTALFCGISAGYAIKRMNLGINFLAAHGIDNASAGFWHDKNFHYTSIFIGYDLFSKQKY
jgi:hypothetical protein